MDDPERVEHGAFGVGSGANDARECVWFNACCSTIWADSEFVRTSGQGGRDQRAKNAAADVRACSTRAAQSSMLSIALSRLRGPPWVAAIRGSKNARASVARSALQKPLAAYGR